MIKQNWNSVRVVHQQWLKNRTELLAECCKKPAEVIAESNAMGDKEECSET